MNITVRLYKLHDFDLIYLYKNLRFPIKDAMYEALNAYVKKEPVKIRFPISSIEEDKLPKIKNAQFHLILNNEKDREIIEYLKTLKDYYRNSFLKNVLRYYMYGCPLYVYEKEPNIKEEQLRIDIVEYVKPKIIEKPLMKKRNNKKKMKLTEDQYELMKNIGAFDKDSEMPEINIIEK